MVTPDGTWKLAGFMHSVPCSHAAGAAGAAAGPLTFNYDDAYPAAPDLLTKVQTVGGLALLPL